MKSEIKIVWNWILHKIWTVQIDHTRNTKFTFFNLRKQYPIKIENIIVAVLGVILTWRGGGRLWHCMRSPKYLKKLQFMQKLHKYICICIYLTTKCDQCRFCMKLLLDIWGFSYCVSHPHLRYCSYISWINDGIKLLTINKCKFTYQEKSYTNKYVFFCFSLNVLHTYNVSVFNFDARRKTKNV